jgi:hypothetical protein
MKREIVADKKIDRLIQAIDELYPSDRTLMWKSFLKGVFMGLGTTIGVSLVLALVTFVVSLLRNDPFMRSILDFLQIERLLRRS